MSPPSLIQSFEFLEKLPYIPVLIVDHEERECIVCLEDYDESAPWHQGGTVNRPVKLSNCRQTFGLQCLARFMFSPNFDGCCPLCRTEIVSALPNNSDSHTDALSALVTFMALIQSELTVAKAALWKIVKAHTIWEGRRPSMRDVYLERIEMLLDEYANVLCGGSEGYTDPVDAMDAREERHRNEIQAWADSQRRRKLRTHETIAMLVNETEEANEANQFSMGFTLLNAIPLALLSFHTLALTRPHLRELQLDAMLAIALVSWAMATGLAVYTYRRGIVSHVDKSYLYGMPIGFVILLCYAALI